MKIGGIIEQTHLALYTISSLKDQPGTVAEVLKVFAEHHINLAYITEGAANAGNALLAFCVDCDDKETVDKLLLRHTGVAGKNISKHEYVALIGIYGPHFREKPAIAVNVFEVLGKAGINILGISSSISTVSCVVRLQEMEKAKKALLDFFELP